MFSPVASTVRSFTFLGELTTRASSEGTTSPRPAANLTVRSTHGAATRLFTVRSAFVPAVRASTVGLGSIPAVFLPFSGTLLDFLLDFGGLLFTHELSHEILEGVDGLGVGLFLGLLGLCAFSSSLLLVLGLEEVLKEFVRHSVHGSV